MALKEKDIEALLASQGHLRGADLRRVRLKDLDLAGRDLTGAKLDGANLSGAKLEGALLVDTDLSGARLNDANLARADLSNSDLSRARLTGADLTGARLVGAKMPRLTLTECRLDGADLSQADLTEADFSHTTLRGVRFVGANLSRATLDAGTYEDVDLTEANLEEAYLERATLTRVNLTGARLRRANLVQARLLSPTLDRASLVEADLAESTVEDGSFEGADLSHAIFDHATFLRVDLTGATVKGADLQGASGLGPEVLEALKARGAVVHALALTRLLEGLLGRRWVKIAGAVALAGALGGFVYFYTRPTQQPLDATLAQALELRQADEKVEALALYDALLSQVGPKSEQGVQILYLKAETLLEMDKPEEASEIYRLLAEQNDQNKDEAINAELRLVSVLIEQGSFDKAIPALEKIAADPDAAPADVARALIALSSVYEKMGFGDKAVEVAGRALEKYPDHPVIALQVNRHMATLLAQRGRFDEAEALLDRLEPLVHDDSERAELLMSRARLYEAKGDEARSLEALATLLKDFPNNPEVSPEVRFELANLLAEQGQTDEALRLLQDLTEGEISSSLKHQATLSLARIQATLGQNLKALALLEALAGEDQLAPEDRGQVLMTQAEILGRIGKKAEALALLGQLVDQVELGQSGPALLTRARLQEERGSLTEAEATYRDVLTRFSAVPDMVTSAKMGLAALMEAQGRLDGAEAQYKELLAAGGNEDERAHLWQRLGMTQAARGDLAAAEATFQQMRQELPTGEGQAQATFGLAEVALLRKDVPSAVALYRQVADEVADPNIRAFSLQNLARLYVEKGQVDDAKLTYQEIVDRVPPGHDAAFQARMGLGHLYASQRELDRAFKLYRAALEGTTGASQQAEALLAVGRLQLDTADVAGAKTTFEEVIARFAGRPEAVDQGRIGLAEVLRKQGDVSGALALYQQVAEGSEEPQTASAALKEWAALLDEQGRSEEALRVQRQILSRFGEDPETSFNASWSTANAQLANGEAEAAVATFTALLAQAPDPGLRLQVLSGLAQAQAQAGDLDGAAATWQRLIESTGDPDLVHNAHMGLAGVRVAQGRPDDARALYQKVASESPDRGLQAWALESIAQLTAQQGDNAAAMARYTEIIERYGDDAGVAAGARLGLGQLKRAEDDLKEAETLFEEVARSATDTSQRAWARLYLAQVWAEQDEAEKGLTALLQLAQDFPDEQEVLLNARLSLAGIYRSRNRMDEASQAYRSVAEGNGFAEYRVSALEGLASIAVEQENKAAARAAYQQILDRFGALPEATFNAKLGLARIKITEGKDSARTAATELEALVGTTTDPVLKAWGQQALAQAWVAAGEPAKAKAAYEQLLQTDGGQAELAQEARSYLGSM